MKKRETHYLKKLFMMLTFAALLVSCGQDNESGRDDDFNNPFGVSGGFNYNGFTGTNGQSANALLEVIGNENPCRSSFGVNSTSTNSRVRTVVPLNGINVNAGAVHVGVTPEGDIGVISRQSNSAVMELYLCVRPDLTGQGSITQQPALNTSFSCPISEITATNVSLPSNAGLGPYLLQFAPIHIPNAGRYSSICTNQF